MTQLGQDIPATRFKKEYYDGVTRPLYGNTLFLCDVDIELFHRGPLNLWSQFTKKRKGNERKGKGRKGKEKQAGRKGYVCFLFLFLLLISGMDALDWLCVNVGTTPQQ